MEFPSQIEAVIWDLDGTLLDSFDIYYAALSEATATHDVPMPGRATTAANFHGSLQASIQAALQIPDADLLALVIDEFLEVQGKYYDEPDEHLFPDAVQLVRRVAKLGLPQFL